MRKLDPIHSDNIDDDGIVDGYQYETYYQVCKSVIPDTDYLRVSIDGGFTDVETRIPYELLKQAGFDRIRQVEEEISSGMTEFDADAHLPEGVVPAILGIELPTHTPDPLDDEMTPEEENAI